MYSFCFLIYNLNMKRIIAILIVCIFITTSCKDANNRKKHTTLLSAGMAHNFILQQLETHHFKSLMLGPHKEFSDGHIEGAKNIDWLNNRDALLNLNKQNTYLIYCRSGRRSQLATDYLSNAGFNDLFHLKGGIIEWQKKLKALNRRQQMNAKLMVLLNPKNNKYAQDKISKPPPKGVK